MTIKLDGKGLSELGLSLLRDYQDSFFVETRDRTMSIPGRHGLYDFGADLGTRSFNLPMRLRGQKTNFDVLQKIKELKRILLDGRGNPRYFKLEFDEEPDKYYMVRYSGNTSVSRLLTMASFSLPLTAFDPYKYSKVTNDEITWGSETITFESDYLFGATGGETHTITSPLNITETVNGDNVRPVFYINGSGNSVLITSGENSFALGSFTNASFIVDGDNYTVLKDGLNGLSFFSGDFIELTNGDNEISVSGNNMNFTLEVRFRDKYI